jgi:Protein of unknown function (DUF2442)
MLEVAAVEPLWGRVVRMTLSDGTVVERDLTDLLAGGGIFASIATDDSAFRRVAVHYGTLVWPGDVDIAQSLHVDELLADWDLARAGLPLSRIAPLR